jgi:hypothetical protein
MGNSPGWHGEQGRGLLSLLSLPAPSNLENEPAISRAKSLLLTTKSAPGGNPEVSGGSVLPRHRRNRL